MVRLSGRGWQPNVQEKNWIPFVYNNTLYISYWLCPHAVLRCNVTDGKCVNAYHTKLDGCDQLGEQRLRGGSPFVATGGMFVGIAHQTKTLRASERAARNIGSPFLYQHRFYTVEGTPPFALRYLSPKFIFPRFIVVLARSLFSIVSTGMSQRQKLI